MGRPKAALPIGHRGDTFLNYLLRTLYAAHIPDIIVVTGGASDVTRAAAGRVRRRVRFAHNNEWSTGQLSSLLRGLEERPDDLVEAALVTLVDSPFASPATFGRVLDTWRRTRALIVRPARGEVHGHPVMFDRALFAELRAADRSVGAKAVVRAHAHHILNVEVDDAGAFVDVDTEQDYRAALRHLALAGPTCLPHSPP
jgi:molybdenum cofactor cytidylyltransferase